MTVLPVVFQRPVCFCRVCAMRLEIGPVEGMSRRFESMRLLIVGLGQAGQMGNYLGAAAEQLGTNHKILDARAAEANNRIVRSFCWHLRGKRPRWLRRFSAEVLNTCVATQCDVVLTTGRAPLDRWHIERLRELGVRVINYSTDDPWNPAQRAEWFISALPAYTEVFTPRRANLGDFRRAGVRSVHYLPFAFDPNIHRPWQDGCTDQRAKRCALRWGVRC